MPRCVRVGQSNNPPPNKLKLTPPILTYPPQTHSNGRFSRVVASVLLRRAGFPRALIHSENKILSLKYVYIRVCVLYMYENICIYVCVCVVCMVHLSLSLYVGCRVLGVLFSRALIDSEKMIWLLLKVRGLLYRLLCRGRDGVIKPGTYVMWWRWCLWEWAHLIYI